MFLSCEVFCQVELVEILDKILFKVLELLLTIILKLLLHEISIIFVFFI